MKKLLTSMMVLAAALSASAQNFTITDGNGTAYHDGDEVIVGYYRNQGSNYFWNPELTVKINKATLFGKSTLTMTAEASVADFAQFCAVEPCEQLGADPVVKTGSYSEGQTVALMLDAVRKPLPAEPVVVDLTVTDTRETVNLKVKFLPMSADEAGIDAPEAAPASTIRINGRSVSYHLNSAARFTLYNISGRPVVDRHISGSGSIDLGSYPAGVYVYRCSNATGKIVLR